MAPRLPEGDEIEGRVRGCLHVSPASSLVRRALDGRSELVDSQGGPGLSTLRRKLHVSFPGSRYPYQIIRLRKGYADASSDALLWCRN